MNRGDCRESIFKDDANLEIYWRTIGEDCGKTG